MSEPSDSDLIERLAEGDREAFVTLLNRFEKRLYHRFLRTFQDRQEAADLTQQAFLVLLRNPRGYRPELGHLGVYLFGIARILCLKRLHQLRRESRAAKPRSEDEASGDAGPLESLLHQERERILLAGIGRLPPVRRRALLMKEVEGLPVARVAEALRLSESTVKSHLRRARIQLRRLLSPYMSRKGEWE